MNDLNISLFRAEIIEDKRDEDYKKGFTIEVNNVKYAIGNYTKGLIEVEVDGQTRFFPIKKNTLAIHFPDMIDSEGNKIFASLDILGGSLIEYEEKIFEAMYLNGLIQGVANMDSIQNSLFKYSKAIGIQK